jgi:hypothetical protein
MVMARRAVRQHYVQSSHAREFHPCILTEPYPDEKSGQAVNLSIHTALHVLSQR